MNITRYRSQTSVGDGRAELCFDRYTDKMLLKSFPDNRNLFVRNITDGLNWKTSFTYSSIANDAEVYSENGNKSAFPVSKAIKPLYVVKSLSFQAGTQESHIN